MPVDPDVLKKVYETLNHHQFTLAEPGDYAELLDEGDEQGTVVLRRKSGMAFCHMPREVWDNLREAAIRK